MTRNVKAVLIWFCALVVLPTAGLAVTPDEMLADPAMEARARAISQDLRCVVCQNQSIDDSNAPLAKDLRILVRDRLKAGDTDADAKAFVVARYGNFVLLQPPMQTNTLMLWLTPLLLGLAGLIALLRYLKHQAAAPVEPARQASPDAMNDDLTAAEQKRLKEILEKGFPT